MEETARGRQPLAASRHILNTERVLRAPVIKWLPWGHGITQNCCYKGMSSTSKREEIRQDHKMVWAPPHSCGVGKAHQPLLHSQREALCNSPQFRTGGRMGVNCWHPVKCGDMFKRVCSTWASANRNWAGRRNIFEGIFIKTFCGCHRTHRHNMGITLVTF